MSIWGRKIRIDYAAIVAAVFVVVAGLASVATKSSPREITLVARDMAFYVDGVEGAEANPIIQAKAGETLRIVLRNRDRGMTHDFAIPAVDAAVDPIKWNEEASLTFEVPGEPGSYEYVCRPHLLMMKGTLKVSR